MKSRIIRRIQVWGCYLPDAPGDLHSGREGVVKSRVSLLKTSLQGEISGLYLQIDFVKVILINSAKSLGHQNFTLTHEFYQGVNGQLNLDIFGHEKYAI